MMPPDDLTRDERDALLISLGLPIWRRVELPEMPRSTFRRLLALAGEGEVRIVSTGQRPRHPLDDDPVTWAAVDLTPAALARIIAGAAHPVLAPAWAAAWIRAIARDAPLGPATPSPSGPTLSHQTLWQKHD